MSAKGKLTKRRKAPVSPVVLDEAEETVLQRIADGDAMTQIAADYKVSRMTLNRWTRATPDREQAVADAKRLSADALVDKARDVLHEAREVDTAAKANIAGKTVDFLKWLAGTRSSEYRDQSGGVSVHLDLGKLHLAALQQAGRMPPRPDGPVVDAELLEEN